jgi:uncharacterized protein YfaP (DUF2135 family)
MTSRRGRSDHVKPRPPSSGRPRANVRKVTPSPQRVRRYRGIEPRRRRLPLAARAVLALSVVALGAAVFLTATGGIGPLVASLGNSLEGAFGKLTFSAQPSASEVVATDSPIIAAPDHPFTNVAKAQLRITVPVAVIGTTAKVRVYVALEGLSMTAVQELGVGSTTQLTATVDLTAGQNNFTATVLRDGVESAEAPVVTIVLDQDPPKLSIGSPKNDATVNDSKVTITGKTQAQADLIAHNAANGASVTGKAASDGTFSLVLPIDQGSNAIDIKATDPAGNATTVTLTVKQGSGDMTAQLYASRYSISVSHPPASLLVWVIVKDPNGAALAGATATFSVGIAGQSPVTSGPKVTDATGRASFTVPLTGPMTVNSGLVVVTVSYPGLGDTTDRVTLAFVK